YLTDVGRLRIEVHTEVDWPAVRPTRGEVLEGRLVRVLLPPCVATQRIGLRRLPVADRCDPLSLQAKRLVPGQVLTRPVKRQVATREGNPLRHKGVKVGSVPRVVASFGHVTRATWSDAASRSVRLRSRCRSAP